ncbi:hypothetical protein HanRHA438_Chr08g0354651 [Helianthus annuus]|nr:hypothetical protein HanIR_Chr08g0370481 [Helianthus annuus]KAJ0898243.1 hypothetical protein HanRHA438_Chr08g0354651 [Helianthus annuus]
MKVKKWERVGAKTPSKTSPRRELRIWHGLAGFPAAFRFRVIRVQGLWLFPGQAIAPEPCLFFCCIMVVVVLFKTSNGCWVFTHLDNV